MDLNQHNQKRLARKRSISQYRDQERTNREEKAIKPAYYQGYDANKGKHRIVTSDGSTRDVRTITNGGIGIGQPIEALATKIDAMPRRREEAVIQSGSVTKYLKIKYLYRVFEDGVWTFYAAGHQQKPGKVFTINPVELPSPSAIDNQFIVDARIDNLGRDSFTVTLKIGSLVRFYKKSALQWEVDTGSQNINLVGHGFASFYSFGNVIAPNSNIRKLPYTRGYVKDGVVFSEDAGLAVDVLRTSASNPTYTIAYNHQIYANPERLIPYGVDFSDAVFPLGDSYPGFGSGNTSQNGANSQQGTFIRESLPLLNQKLTNGVLLSTTGTGAFLDPTGSYTATYKWFSPSGEFTKDFVTFIAYMDGSYPTSVLASPLSVRTRSPYFFRGLTVDGYTIPSNYLSPLDYQSRVDNPPSEFKPKYISVFDSSFTAFYPKPFNSDLTDDYSVLKAKDRGEQFARFIVETWSNQIEKQGEKEETAYLPDVSGAIIYNYSYHPQT